MTDQSTEPKHHPKGTFTPVAMAELKLTRSGATPKLFISFKVFCTPGFGKGPKGWAFLKLRFWSWLMDWKISCSLPRHPRKLERRWVHCTSQAFADGCVPWSLGKLYQRWKMGISLPKNGGFSVAIHYHLSWVTNPPRHTTSVGRMPNCCIFWKWAWRAGWKNLSWFFQLIFFRNPPKIVQEFIPQPNFFPSQKPISPKP